MTTCRRTQRKVPSRNIANEDEKDCILRILTDHFLNTGASYTSAAKILQAKLGKAIKSTVYNNYMTTIMRTSFRFLEDFITKHCNKRIRPITFDEERMIRTPMINCRKWMSPQHIQTLFKVANICIKQASEEITQQQALDLYREIFSLINNCQKRFKLLDDKKRDKQIRVVRQSMGLASKEIREPVRQLTKREQEQEKE